MEIKSELEREIKSLIARECANYQGSGPFGVKNFCWKKEKVKGKVCVYFNQKTSRCGYFESTVLALNAELEEDYNKRLEEEDGRQIEDRPTLQREGAGGSPRRIQGVTPQPQKPGVSVGQSLRQGVLSRPNRLPREFLS